MDNIEEKIKGVIDYDKIKIDYSHRELFMSYLKNNLNILHISTVKQGLQ
jgi:hypothetical protein